MPYAKWFVGGKLNVSYNCLDRHVETARRTKAAIIWEGEPGDTPDADLLGPLSRGQPLRGRAQAARREEGRPRHHLHADGAGDGHRDARLHPHRGAAQRGLRRLRARRRPRADPRRRVQGADHRRRRLPARRHRAAQEERGRGAQGVPGRQDGDRAQADGPGDRHGARPRRLVGRVRQGRARLLPRREDGLRGHALPPLHVGVDRQAQGHHPHDGRLPHRRLRDARSGSSTCARTTCTGAPPTSAG